MRARLEMLQKKKKITNACCAFQWWLEVQEHKEWEGKRGILLLTATDLPKTCQRGFFHCMIQ